MQERVALAWKAYRAGRARGAEHHAARAALLLGALEQQRGNTATARTAYQHVIDFGEAGVADQAAAALAAINPSPPTPGLHVSRTRVSPKEERRPRE